MCHRYFQAHQSAKVAERYAARDLAADEEDIPEEVFPAHRSVVVLSDQGERQLKTMYWGFIPEWVKDADLAAYDKPNNSRSETVIRNLMEGRGMYFQAMHTGRCILTATSWCEWTGEKGNKVAHRLSVRGEEFVSFAGLYTYRPGFPGLSCTMLTTAAAGRAAEFHHRVPVVLLSREDEDRWLDPKSNPRELVDLLQCIPDEKLETEVLDDPPRIPNRRTPGQGDLFTF